MHFSTFLLTLAVFATAAVQGQLSATKLENGGVYKLENQNDGNFLTASTGLGTISLDRSTPEQKWIFSQQGDGLWTLRSSNSEEVLGGVVWQVDYVGHGKYLFTDTTTLQCLQGSGRGNVENTCQKGLPNQRWFPHRTSI